MPRTLTEFMNKEFEDAIDFIAQVLAPRLAYYWPPDRPQSLNVSLTSEESNMLKYTVAFPAPTDNDVISNELTVTIAGESVAESKPSGQDFEFTCEQDVAVKLEARFIDDAGNRSEAYVYEFTTADTLAPDAPAGLTVALIEES